jgi:glycosyltransferase involved in cell wall biosynthesis
MPTPRVLAIYNGRVFYGQERANLLVLQTLKAQGCDVLAIVDEHGLANVVHAELAKCHIPCVAVPMIGRRSKGYFLDFLFGNLLRYLRARRLVKRLIAQFRPTGIHVSNPFGFLLIGSIVAPDLPIVYRIGDKPAIHNLPWQWLWRRVAKRVDHFVADSDFIAREVGLLGVEMTRISVIFTPPARRVVPPRPDAVPSSLQSMLFIGQLSHHKGVDRLVEAFRKIASDYPEARLTLLGRISTWSGDDWQRELRDSTLADPLLGGRVSFPGETEDIYDYLAQAAFVVVPSICEEAFGLVVGEAKAAARPSVVFPSGGLIEQVNHGEDGFICRDCSVEALVEGLRYYLDAPDRVQSHGRAALQSLTRLGSDKFGERWLAVYQSTMKGGADGNDRRRYSGDVGE